MPRIKLDREKITSPAGMFILYILLSSIVIMGFRFIFPGEPPPLAYFFVQWRLLRGWEDLLNLFPALALSALVIPYGFRHGRQDEYSSFSPRFLKTLSPSIFSAIAAAAIYGVIFILLLPMVMNKKTDLQTQGRLYRLSVEQARSYAAEGEWYEAAGFLAICEMIWPGNKDVEELRTEAFVRLDEFSHRQEPYEAAALPSRLQLTEPGILNASEALRLAERAMQAERFFDAHWLATLAGDLAGPGSAESALAARLASQAWNAVSSLAPNARETEAFRIFHLKQEAYRALVSNEWILAYYNFLEYISLAPGDPEGHYFLDLSEQGLVRMAFFADEMELRESPVGPLFSLPLETRGNIETGRMVMRFASLSFFPDLAYGIGLEIMAFDREGRLLWRLESPYAKLLPVTLDGRHQVSMLMRALDRYNRNISWEPRIINYGAEAPSNSQMFLNLNWEDFMLLSEVSGNFGSLNLSELYAASKLGYGYGYLPQIFEAELITRIAEPVFFLPFLILFLSVGWRFRAVKKPMFIWIPMLGVLPLVVNGIYLLYRSYLDNIAVWAVISFGFSMSIVIFALGAVVLFVTSLIYLASQKG